MIATEKEAKEPTCKRKRMDRGMEIYKSSKNREPKWLLVDGIT